MQLSMYRAVVVSVCTINGDNFSVSESSSSLSLFWGSCWYFTTISYMDMSVAYDLIHDTYTIYRHYFRTNSSSKSFLPHICVHTLTYSDNNVFGLIMDVSVEEVKGCMCIAIHKLMSTSSLEGKNFMIEPSPLAATKFAEL